MRPPVPEYIMVMTVQGVVSQSVRQIQIYLATIMNVYRSVLQAGTLIITQEHAHNHVQPAMLDI